MCRAGHRRLEHPQLRRQHGTRAYLRADLALRRSVLAYQRAVEAGAWQRAGQFCFFDYPIHDLAGSTLGIIGEGAIGQAVAALGKAFGMRTLYAAHKGASGLGPLYTPFEEVLETSDVITLHCPLMPSTRNLIAAAEFAQMKRRPLLINTARGGLVNEEDLVVALRQGQVAGAAFDVATASRRRQIMRSCSLSICRTLSSRRMSRGRAPKPSRPWPTS